MDGQQPKPNQEETKECPRCMQILPLSKFKDSTFDKVRNKFRCWEYKICKKCKVASHKEKNKARNAANMEAGLKNPKPKVCSTCKQLKDRSEFPLDSSANDGLCYYCKNCGKKVNWFSQFRKCSATDDDWQRYCATTHCQCCGVEFHGRGCSKKNQDHDHNKNVLRGVICNRCNTLEGRMRSAVKRAIRPDNSEVDPRIRQCVSDYIEKWDAQILGETKNQPPLNQTPNQTLYTPQ